jgi:hypothetical protein
MGYKQSSIRHLGHILKLLFRSLHSVPVYVRFTSENVFQAVFLRMCLNNGNFIKFMQSVNMPDRLGFEVESFRTHPYIKLVKCAGSVFGPIGCYVCKAVAQVFW